jgi:hypothetical protein
MKLFLRIEFLDGNSKNVTVVAPDMVAYESRFDKSIQQLESSVRLTDLMFLAWHCEFRTKSTALEFEAWCDLVAGVSMGDADPK